MGFVLPDPKNLGKLSDKIRVSHEVILEAYRRFNPSQIGLIWSGGKDSTLLLKLLRDTESYPITIFLDNGNVFPTLVRFATELAKDWEFEFEIVSNEGRPSRTIQEELREYMEKNGIRVLFTALRADDHEEEGAGYFTQGANPNHVRVCPLLHFRERDVWDATFALKIPYCSLYEQGYRTLGRRETSRPAQEGVPACEQNFGRIKVGIAANA